VSLKRKIHLAFWSLTAIKPFGERVISLGFHRKTLFEALLLGKLAIISSFIVSFGGGNFLNHFLQFSIRFLFLLVLLNFSCGSIQLAVK